MKKRHHYVWRQYLRAWATDEQIWCLRDGAFFKTNLMNVGQIKGFYDLKELSAEDIAFVRRMVIDRSPPHLQRLNAGWVQLFNFVFEIRNLCAQKGIEEPKVQDLIQQAISDSEENLHGFIESRAIASIDRLLKEDIAFLSSEDEFLAFVHFLCIQYFRTAGIKDNVLRAAGDKFSHVTDNRLVHNSYRLNLKGGSMRKHKRSTTTDAHGG